MSDPGDEALLAAYREGDLAAFEMLLGRYRGPIFNFLLRSARDRGRAEELYQDVWMKVVERCDGVLVLHDDGALHAELAMQCMGKGKPVFVDKPFETEPAKAKRMAAKARETNTPLFSASSLRFSRELQAAVNDEEGGKIVSALCFSPHSPKPSMPGWIYYGTHAVEPLLQIMGRGCVELRCHLTDYGPVAIGTWSDGRVGIARATLDMSHGYGLTVWRERSIASAIVDTQWIYPELLKAIKGFFETGVSPVEPEQSVEAVAFMCAANESMANDGAAVKLDV